MSNMQMSFEEKLQDDLDCLQTDYDGWCRKTEDYEVILKRWEANQRDQNLFREKEEWYKLVRDYGNHLLRTANDMEENIGRFLGEAQLEQLQEIINALS